MPSGRSSTLSMASRVVPPSSDTTMRSLPSSRFTSELLPTFGRPTTATRIASSSATHRLARVLPRAAASPRRAPRARPRRRVRAPPRSRARARSRGGGTLRRALRGGACRSCSRPARSADRSCAARARSTSSSGSRPAARRRRTGSHRRRDRGTRLRLHGRGESLARLRLETGGVDHDDASPLHLDRLDDAIARETGESSTIARRRPA